MAAIQLLGLDHVVLRVADSGRSRAWYESVLGCTVERVLPAIGLTQLRAGSTLIDLVEVGMTPSAEGRNMDHFCVQLATFGEGAIVAHLEQHGVAAGAAARRYGALGHGLSIRPG
jgi:glyoxylase I family protein